MKQETVTLKNLCEAKAEAIFQRDLVLLLENVVDDKIPADVPRELVLSIKFAPGKDRKTAAVLVSSKLKLAAGAAAGGTVYIQKQGSEIKCFPQAPLGFPTLGDVENKK